MKYFDNDDLAQKSCDENDSVLVKCRQPVINLATKQAMVANQLLVLHKWVDCHRHPIEFELVSFPRWEDLVLKLVAKGWLRRPYGNELFWSCGFLLETFIRGRGNWRAYNIGSKWLEMMKEWATDGWECSCKEEFIYQLNLWRYWLKIWEGWKRKIKMRNAKLKWAHKRSLSISKGKMINLSPSVLVVLCWELALGAFRWLPLKNPTINFLFVCFNKYSIG